jgi:hypothetical protein
VGPQSGGDAGLLESVEGKTMKPSCFPSSHKTLDRKEGDFRITTARRLLTSNDISALHSKRYFRFASTTSEQQRELHPSS